jgi:hypothetical protein
MNELSTIRKRSNAAFMIAGAAFAISVATSNTAAGVGDCEAFLRQAIQLKQREAYHHEQADKWFDLSLQLDQYSDAELDELTVRWEREMAAAFSVLERIVALSDEYVERSCDQIKWFNTIDN